MKTYTLFRKLEGHVNNVVSCCFSPDSAVLATASWDTQVILWDPYMGKKLKVLYHLYPPPNMIYAAGENNSWVRGVSYSKDGLNVVTISDDQYAISKRFYPIVILSIIINIITLVRSLIRFWNLMGEVDPEAIAVEDDDILCCSYSPSGRCVAVG